MSRPVPGQETHPDTAPVQPGACPRWCVAPHGLHAGEEDWVHISEPVALSNRVLARLCMTVDPVTEAVDGPYVLIGSEELTPAEANDLGLALQQLASAAAEAIRPASP